MLAPNELAIARSVIYAALFDYPLTLDQLHESLIGSTESAADILATYRTSQMLPLIVEYRDGFFFPAGRADLVAERRRREALSLAFLKRHVRLLNVFCAIPYTRTVALSGSIAHLNADENADLDLFIVTRGRHVWSVTVAVLVIAKLFRRRDVTCANFVMADTHLVLEQQDLFTANQTIHLKPLIGGRLFCELVRANPFVTEFYPNFCPSDASSFGFGERAVLRRAKAAMEWALYAPSIAVEALCRFAYGWHLRRRSATWQSPEQVRLGTDCLKLHTRSHRRSILERFEAAVRESTSITRAATAGSDTTLTGSSGQRVRRGG